MRVTSKQRRYLSNQIFWLEAIIYALQAFKIFTRHRPGCLCEPTMISNLFTEPFAQCFPIAHFERRIADFYPRGHHDDPVDTLLDRRGTPHRVPWVTLAIGVVTSDLCENIDYLELEDIGTAVLKGVSAGATSYYHVNQRKIVGRSAPR